jgi:phage repressor protein C with HTH and peptisase S24 domain
VNINVNAPSKTTLADRIKIVRNSKRKRTQEEFSASLGLGRASVANWERGGRVTGDNMLKIFDQGGVSLRWLRTGEGEMSDDATASIDQQAAAQGQRDAALETRLALTEVRLAEAQQERDDWKAVALQLAKK